MLRNVVGPMQIRLPVVALALAVLSAACSLLPAGLLPDGSGILVTVETRGGECPGGPCGERIVIHRDGTVETARSDATAGPPIPAETVALIAGQIATTDWTAVRAVPFTGECPTAFDGQETVYTFPTAAGVQVFSSCENDLSGVEVFTTIQETLFGTPG